MSRQRSDNQFTNQQGRSHPGGTTLVSAFWQLTQRYRWPIIGAVLVIAVITSLLTKPDRPAPQSSSVVPSPVSTPQQSPTPAPAPTPSPAISPSPASIAPPSQPASQTTSEPENQLSEIPLIGSPILLADLDDNGQLVYFLDPEDMHFKRYEIGSGAVTTFAAAPPGLESGVWSPDHQQLLLLLRNEQTEGQDNPYYTDDLPYQETRVLLFNVTTGEGKLLNDNISAASWLGNDRIIYHYRSGIHQNLSIAQPDGLKWRNIDRIATDLELIWAGHTALRQKAGESTVIRYDQNGKILETHSVPTDFRLSQSTWLNRGRQALYWTKENGLFTLKQLLPTGEPKTLLQRPETEDDFTILWDNRTGRIYLASYFGLEQLPIEVK